MEAGSCPAAEGRSTVVLDRIGTRNRYREIAEADIRYLRSPAILGVFGFLPDVSLAEDELRNGAVHVTIVRPGMIRAVALTAPHWPPSR